MYQPLGIFRHDGQKKKNQKPKTKKKEKEKKKAFGYLQIDLKRSQKVFGFFCKVQGFFLV